MLRGLCAGIALILAGTACFGRAPNPGTSFRVGSVTGNVQVRTSSAGEWQPVISGLRVRPGSEIKTAEGAAVAFERDDGARVDLGAGSIVGIDSVRRLSLEMGRTLVATSDLALTVVSSGVETTAKKTVYRVDRGFSVRIGVYGGEAIVAEAGSKMTVPALRQVEVAGGIVPRDAAPLQFATTDPWDRQLLADVIDLDRQLRTYGRTFKADFAAKAFNPAFYTTIVPTVPPAEFASLISSTGDPADALFGAVMAIRLKGKAAGVLQSLLGLRLAGATWGLIAKIMNVSFRDYVDAVVSAVVPGSVVRPGEPTPGSTPGPGPRGTPSPRPSGSPSPRPTGSPTTNPSPTPTTSPSPTSSPCSDLDRVLGRCSGVPGPLPGGISLAPLVTGLIPG